MHLPDSDDHFDQDRQREETREQSQHERNSAEEFCSSGKIGHPRGQSEGSYRVHVMMKPAEDFFVAMRNQDSADGQPHDKLRERLQAVQETEIQGSPP